MFCIKFVSMSEWRVQHRTEECAERTWERETGAPLVPRKREQGAASRCHGNVIRGHRWCRCSVTLRHRWCLIPVRA
ncbi:MAG: hypothetical protein IJA18_01215 [Ruminococcus sp.]|nr:hypothetical protein [Ruminococcus sp.]